MTATRRRAAITMAVLTTVFLPLAACGDLLPDEDAESTSATSEPAPSRTEDARAGSVSLEVGEQVLLDLGEYNSSIGDAWGVIDSTSSDVADTDMHATSVEGADDEGVSKAGAPSDLGVLVTGRKAGETTLTLQYCYRTEVVAGCDQGETPTDPIEITVTVK